MFTKFLLTVAVVALVWLSLKYVQRVGEIRGRAQGRRERPQAEDRPRFRPVDDGESVHDLVKCPRCGTYRSPKLGHCGQEGCPY